MIFEERWDTGRTAFGVPKGRILLLIMKKANWYKGLAAFILAVCLTMSVSAFTPYDSYTYSDAIGYAEAVPSPSPYIPQRSIGTQQLGMPLSRPCDFAYGPDGNLYIVDAELNKIMVVNADFQVVREITGFENGKENDSFRGPRGLFLNEEGFLYVCDTENGRIVQLDANDRLVQIYSCPSSPLLGESYTFKPAKVVVDESGTLYIINTNEYAGLMKLTPQGAFVSFIGSNKAIVNPLVKFWKKIMSEEQNNQLLTFVPVEYSNISLDDSGFIYAVSAAKAENTPIRRLNLSGQDILIRSGYVEVMGDLLFRVQQGKEGKTENRSVLMDVCSAENGNYFALDATKGRIFTYNREGYLLYVFGGKGTQVGTFSSPSAIERQGENILVLDEVNATITVFEKTVYASLITKAEDSYYRGNYEASMEQWNAVLKSNAFFELAYLQMGKIYMQQDDYQEAMRSFKLGNYRGDTITYMTGYNKAFTEYRKEWMAKKLGVMVASGLLLAVIASAFNRHKKRRRGIAQPDREDTI